MGAFFFGPAPVGMILIVTLTDFGQILGVLLVFGLAALWPVGALARRIGPMAWLLPAISAAMWALFWFGASALYELSTVQPAGPPGGG